MRRIITVIAITASIFISSAAFVDNINLREKNRVLKANIATLKAIYAKPKPELKSKIKFKRKLKPSGLKEKKR